MKGGESDAAYSDRVKLLLGELGFRTEVAAIDRISLVGKVTTMISFNDAAMAQHVLGSAFKFRPDHWLQGPEKRDEIASVLIQLKDSCLAYARRERVPRVRENGFVHVSRWQRGSAQGQSQPARAPAAAPARSGLAQRLV